MGDIYALDFDGVLCDSVGETAISCVKAAAKLRWPELFATVDSSLEDWFVDQMRILRKSTAELKRYEQEIQLC
ncbi:hypothetical protein HanPI659440_Chr11g0421681 [Helianthus annuus]|nr:hypothetical protein HanPI659440_Chr11g0421681 [Helianthus annuus]